MKISFSVVALTLIFWYTKDILFKTYTVYITDGIYTEYQFLIDTWVLIAGLIFMLVVIVLGISLLIEKLFKNKIGNKS